MASPKRLHFLVEGQTEEIITRSVFLPYFQDRGWLVSQSIVTTKQPAGGGKFRGGLARWSKVDRELRRLLKSNFDVVTTLFDYYGLSLDAPGMSDRPGSDPYARVDHVERAIAKTIVNDRFIPHLTLHEAETWVLAAARQLGSLVENVTLSSDLCCIVDQAGGPELINDGAETAPSKRIMRAFPEYQKTLHGPLAVEDLGLASLRARCPHLDQWIARIELNGSPRDGGPGK